MKILGLDVGKKRIGVAVSDELLITAQALMTIECGTTSGDIERIARLVSEHAVDEVVVGLPLNMNGTESQQTKDVLSFLELLKNAVAVPVKAWDERLTSIQAERTLLEADMSRAKRRSISDRLAAQFILQSYLDSRH